MAWVYKRVGRRAGDVIDVWVDKEDDKDVAAERLCINPGQVISTDGGLVVWRVRPDLLIEEHFPRRMEDLEVEQPT